MSSRRKINATRVTTVPPRPRYQTVALKPEVYDKVVVWADALREKWGRCSIGEAVDFLVDFAGVPEEGE